MTKDSIFRSPFGNICRAIASDDLDTDNDSFWNQKNNYIGSKYFDFNNFYTYMYNFKLSVGFFFFFFFL